jgi:mono/diheme cytochrome c family protein
MAYETDEELEASTNRVMLIGAGLIVLLVLAFPLYRLVEPVNRDDAREEQLESLAEAGESTWSFNCASCHGLNGEGGIGPALNSSQFLESATNLQMEQLVAVGVPGSQMGAYSQDFGGPLTTEQIKAVVTYIRTWEPNAPDNPDWRSMMGPTAAPAGDGGDTTSIDAGGNDAGGGGDDNDS